MRFARAPLCLVARSKRRDRRRRTRHPYASGIGIVNLFLGWTLIGWVVAAAWAASVPRRRD
mgnify:CR=1 FL=1